MVSDTITVEEPSVVDPEADDPVDRSVGPPGRPKRWPLRLAVAAILIAAAALRLVPLTSGLPYLAYVDEGHVFVHGAVMIRQDSRDPGWYDYPTLPITLAAGVERVTMRGESQSQRRANLEALAFTTNYDEIRPESALLLMRLIVAALSVGTVALTMLAARRLWGRRAMVVSGLLAAVSPALVQRGVFDLVDTMLTFFVIAAFVAALSVDRSRCRREVVCRTLLAGVLCGLAAATKYPGVLAVATAIIIVSGARRLDVVERAWRAALVAAGGAVTFVLAMPAILSNRQAVIDGVTANYNLYSTKVEDGQNYWTAIRAVGEVGVIALAVVAAGVVVLLATRGTARSTIAWLTYAVLLAIVASRLAFQPFRNLLSIVPFLCIAIAVAVVWAADAVGRLTPVASRRWVRDGAVVVLTLVLAGIWFQGGVRPFYASSNSVDTRVVARRWLQDHVQPGDGVIVAAELGIAAQELKNIPGRVKVVSVKDTVPPADLEGVRYVVTGLPLASANSWLPGPGFQFVSAWGSLPMPQGANFFHTNAMLVQVAQRRS